MIECPLNKDEAKCVAICLWIFMDVASSQCCEEASTENSVAAPECLPQNLTEAECKSQIIWREMSLHILIFIISVLMVLFLLGMLKACFGLCCVSLGALGLDTLTGPPQMCRYYEFELRNRCIKFDNMGYPVHPDTGRRTVRTRSRINEFCLNIAFFLVFPLAAAARICKTCCVRDQEMVDDPCSKKKHGHRDLFTSSSSYEDDEDNSFVAAQFLKSRESLGNGKKKLKKKDSCAGGVTKPLLNQQKCAAKCLTKQLQESHIVYRNMRTPVGGIQFPQGKEYSVRGTFAPCDKQFRFSICRPAKQFWFLDGKKMYQVKDPPLLKSEAFDITYCSAEEVLMRNELTILPRGVCLNVLYPGPESQ